MGQNTRMNIMSFGGAKLYKAVKSAEPQIRLQQPDQIYILAGINNLTTSKIADTTESLS